MKGQSTDAKSESARRETKGSGMRGEVPSSCLADHVVVRLEILCNRRIKAGFQFQIRCSAAELRHVEASYDAASPAKFTFKSSKSHAPTHLQRQGETMMRWG